MKYFLFDVETTGLYQKDEVIQFAGFLLDESGKLMEVVNEYCYPSVSINPSAYAVHKLDNELLWKLSDGLSFEHQFLHHKFLFDDDITFVGWNVSFDCRMVNQTLQKSGYGKFDFGSKENRFNHKNGRHVVDLMAPVAAILGCHSNRLKLSKAVEKLTICSIADINYRYEVIFNKYGKNNSMKFHNALYDSFLYWPLFLEYRDKLRM